jgi:ribosomal protein S1
MTPQIGDIIAIKVQEVFFYGVLGKYKNHRMYVDLIELSWKRPVPKKSIPKIGDEIRVIVTGISHRPDSDFLASVRYLHPEKDPWHDPSIYKIGDEFIGKIDSVDSFGCWALHPSGADVRLLVNGVKLGLKKSQKIALRIISINKKQRSVDAEII